MLEASEDIDWGGTDTDTYQTTWSLAYISTAVYLGYFALLFFSPGAFRKEPQEEKKSDV